MHSRIFQLPFLEELSKRCCHPHQSRALKQRTFSWQHNMGLPRQTVLLVAQCDYAGISEEMQKGIPLSSNWHRISWGR